VYKILRSLLFLFSAETAHVITMSVIKGICALPGGKALLRSFFRTKDQAIWLDGIRFPNRVGLAAGFDKNGKYINEWYQLGFGHVEVGTITPQPQEGNPKPRLFRLPADHALINRMGFNNEGLETLAKRLQLRKPGIIVGGNIGKNKITPNENATEDYVKCFERLFPYVDYFTVNVSSPNTPGLRELQDKEPLTALLNAIMQINKSKEKPKPVYLKIAPDLNDNQLIEICEIVHSSGIQGVIAGNTTINRNNLKTSDEELQAIGAGGLSGKPLKPRSDEMIKLLRQQLGKEKTIIGVGGIETPQDAVDKILAGANLIQIYTGYIYSGPTLVKNILKKLH
jgi:dihydroorotate dehydrogenase